MELFQFEFLLSVIILILVLFFFFNDTATTEIYTLSLHDALPISRLAERVQRLVVRDAEDPRRELRPAPELPRLPPHVEQHVDRKSTRLNSSHANISYAVFCLKKKKMSCTHSVGNRTPLFM